MLLNSMNNIIYSRSAASLVAPYAPARSLAPYAPALRSAPASLAPALRSAPAPASAVSLPFFLRGPMVNRIHGLKPGCSACGH
jgi:hypothetical protein